MLHLVVPHISTLHQYFLKTSCQAVQYKFEKKSQKYTVKQINKKNAKLIFKIKLNYVQKY